MIPSIVCLCLCLADPSAPSVRAVYDLSAILVPATGPAAEIETLPLLPTANDGACEVEEFGHFGADNLLYLITSSIHPEEWEYAGRTLDVIGDNRPQLVVQAPPELQADVRHFLGYVQQSVRRETRVRLDVYRLTGANPEVIQLFAGAGPTPARTAALTAKLKPVSSLRTSLYSGEPQVLLDVERHLYVRDYDIEIAQAAVSHQVVQDRYSSGVSAAIKAELGADARALITFAISDVMESGRRESVFAGAMNALAVEGTGVTSRSGGGNIESPLLSFTTLAGSCRLAAGESTAAFASAADGQSSGALVVITAEKVDALPPPFVLAGRETSIVDIAADVSTGFGIEPFGVAALRFPYEQYGEHFLPLSLAVPQSTGEAQAATERALDWLLADEDDSRTISYEGHFVLMNGPAGSSAQVLSKLRGQLAGMADFGTCQATHQSANGGSMPLFSLPLAVGDAFVVTGTQETYILSNDVDVANNASGTNPNVEAVVSGYAARAHGSATLERRTLAAVLTAQLRNGGRHDFDTGSNSSTLLQQPTFACSLLQADGMVDSGGSLPFGQLRIPTIDGSRMVEVTLGAR